MTIKSIHKKGSKLLMENRRGLFLTNILSKLFERVLENVTREQNTNESISKWRTKKKRNM